jgi:uncharacterized integral membrane protein
MKTVKMLVRLLILILVLATAAVGLAHFVWWFTDRHPIITAGFVVVGAIALVIDAEKGGKK